MFFVLKPNNIEIESLSVFGPSNEKYFEKHRYPSTEERAINTKNPKNKPIVCQNDHIEMILSRNELRDRGYAPEPKKPSNEILLTSTTLKYNSFYYYALYFIDEFCKNG